MKDVNSIKTARQEEHRKYLAEKYGALIPSKYGKNVGFFNYDFQTNKTYWSKSFYRLLHFSKSDKQVELFDLLDYVQKQEVEKVRSGLEYAINNKISFSLDFAAKSSDGMPLHLCITGECHKITEDRFSMDCVVQDVTVSDDIIKGKLLESVIDETLARMQNIMLDVRVDDAGKKLQSAFAKFAGCCEFDSAKVYEYNVQTGEFDSERICDKNGSKLRTKNIKALFAKYYMSTTNKKQTIIIKNLEDIPEKYSEIREKFLKDNVKSLMIMPLIFGGHLMRGVIVIQNNRSSNAFDALTKPHMNIMEYMFANALSDIELRNRLKSNSADIIRKNKEMNEFLVKLSHDIRTPMNSIIGFANIIRQDPNYHDDNHCIDGIVHGGNVLLKMVDNVSEYALIENGKVKIFENAINPYEYLMMILETYENEAVKRSIEIVLNFAEKKAEILRLDSEKLKKIFDILLTNAFKIIENSKLFINVSCVENGRGTYNLEIEIKYPNLHGAIGNNKSSKPKNRTVEILVARKLCEIMHGSISEITSDEYDGFRFVLLNLYHDTIADNFEKPKVKECNFEFCGQTVLVCDDSTNNRFILRKMLEHAGLKVIEASCGADAIICAENDFPEMILLDYEMPGITGVETARIIQNNVRTKNIPIALVTGRVKDSNIDGLDGKEFEIIHKPVDKNNMMSFLAKHLQTADTAQVEKNKLTQNESTIEITPEKLQMLTNFWQTEAKALYEEIVKTYEMEQIKVFNEKCTEFAKKSEFVDLALDCEILGAAIKSFDVVSIKKYLSMIERLFIQL